MNSTDTICALATPAGKGSVGIVRLSGPRAPEIAQLVVGRELEPRFAHFVSFKDLAGNVIDQGVAIYFPQPQSFTGEHVVEFQSHGNPFVHQQLLNCLCGYGARLAIAGEFSERAFLNGKLDLSQLEAIADLINSGSEQAARSAVHSMQGKFSQQIQLILQQLIQIRTHIEATLDFAEEDIEVDVKSTLQKKLSDIASSVDSLFLLAQRGVKMQQGATIVLTGRPNVGKSSLLNALCAEERAIVTSIPGTTRDIVVADIDLEGLPVRLLDTAGIRKEVDEIEQEGIERAHAAIKNADVIVHIIDATADEYQKELTEKSSNTILVLNKVDLISSRNKLPVQVLAVSAKTGEGLNQLRNHIAEKSGLETDNQQTPFSARARHLEAMQRSKKAILSASAHLQVDSPLELAAEELRIAQKSLGEISGEFTPDDLLDYVFREFCIGK